MLPPDELEALADDIALNGQADPITLDEEGRLVDGRNRLAACALIDVEPKFARDLALDSDVRIAEYINSKNAHRRNVTTGQKAMSVAEELAARGRRKNGRWQRGSINETSRLSDDKGWAKAMEQAGLVLDHAPTLAGDVIGGTTTLNEAASEAEANRDAQIREAEAKRIQATQVRDLKSNRPDLAKLVASGELALEDALVIRDKETEAERAEAARVKERRDKFSRDLAFSIHCIAPLAHYEDRRSQVRDELDLKIGVPITAEAIDEAIASLQFIRDTHKESL